MDKLLLINKDINWTSRDVCNKIQHLFHTRKVGHSGTLDPFASGLLLVTINKACKIIPYLDNLKKTYIGEIKLGEETDTLDLTGKIIKEKEVTKLNKKDIEEAFNNYFLGEIEQIPPIFSALHYDGQRLYDLARNGISNIEIKPRKITIYSLKLISFQKDKIKFECVCSTGTYIRSLARDIAYKLNTFGHLISLERIRIGDFNISNAKRIEEINENDGLSVKEALKHLKSIQLENEDDVKKVKNGVNFVFKGIMEDTVLVLDLFANPIAIYKRDKDAIFKCARGLF